MLTKKIGTATIAVASGIACLFPAIAQACIIRICVSGTFVAPTQDGFQEAEALSIEGVDLSEGTTETPVSDSDFLVGAEDVNSLDFQRKYPGSVQNFTAGNKNYNNFLIFCPCPPY
ncbi:MAG: hypothetical protein DSM106950_45325 [Stigonema ocellatum SAG 48.90 = DSM 106950]|nr:hypothetical protein [Stigonema ocellatum SAG 48.90 = DSM 106950]